MELRHIRYFLAVAEEMNFSRAAEKLMIAQPPLSRQIRDLEAELGTPLFIRKPHNLQLTEEGILFRQYAMQILELVDKSAEEVREVKSGLSGTLFIAMVEGAAPRLLAEWIRGFQKLYPHVQYDLWNGNSDDVSHRVLKGLSELAVIMEPHNGEGLNAIDIHTEEWIALIPKDYPLAKKAGDKIAADELLPYELMIPSRECRKSEIEHWFSESVNLKIRCKLSHAVDAYELVKNGVGIAIYPASLANFVKQDEVVVKVIAKPKVSARYVLVWKKDQPLSHLGQEFLEYVRERVSEEE